MPFNIHGMLYGVGGGSGSSLGEGLRSGGSRETKSNVQDLTKRVDRLELICEAMWIIMREKLGVTDDELVARIAELDLSDGVADGKKNHAGPRRWPEHRPRNLRCLQRPAR